MNKRSIKGFSQAGRIARRQIRSVVSAVHVVPSTTGWKVMKTGRGGVTEIFETRRQAVRYAEALSKTKRVSLVIHSKSGKIEMKDPFGRMPVNPKA